MKAGFFFFSPLLFKEKQLSLQDFKCSLTILFLCALGFCITKSELLQAIVPETLASTKSGMTPTIESASEDFPEPLLPMIESRSPLPSESEMF